MSIAYFEPSCAATDPPPAKGPVWSKINPILISFCCASAPVVASKAVVAMPSASLRPKIMIISSLAWPYPCVRASSRHLRMAGGGLHGAEPHFLVEHCRRACLDSSAPSQLAKLRIRSLKADRSPNPVAPVTREPGIGRGLEKVTLRSAHVPQMHLAQELPVTD